MSNNYNIKMISSKNNNVNPPLHIKIVFPKIKLKKCIIISPKKFKGIKKNSINTDILSNNIKKNYNLIDKNSKKSVKSSFKDKTESNNSKHKTPPKVDIQMFQYQTKTNKWKEDMLTYSNKM